MSNTSMPCGLSGEPLYASVSGIETAPVADRHHGQPSVQPAITAVQPELGRLALERRRIEHAAVGRPARVVHRHAVLRGGLRAALAGLEHLVEHALLGLLRIRGRLRHVGGASAAASRLRRRRGSRPRSRRCPVGAFGLFWSAASSSASTQSRVRSPRRARSPTLGHQRRLAIRRTSTGGPCAPPRIEDPPGLVPRRCT